MRARKVLGPLRDIRYVEGYDPYVKADEGIKSYKNKPDQFKAVVWAHPYEPAPEVSDHAYPFWLCTGRVLKQWQPAP